MSDPALHPLAVASSAAADRAAVTVAEAAALSLPAPSGVVVLTGAGTGALAAEAVAALATDARRPVVVLDAAAPVPSWLGPDDLVVSLGPTPTGAAASATGARVVAVGGDLSGAIGLTLSPAGDDRLDLAPLVAGGLTVLDAVGVLPDARGQVDDALDRLRARAAERTGTPSPVARLARRLGRRLPLVVGGALGGVAARSWVAQIARSAKVTGVAHVFPGAAHDAVAGWGQHGDVTRQVFVAVVLRWAGEPAGVAAQLDAYHVLLEEVVADVHRVDATAGGSPLASLFDLVLTGEQVGIALAVQEGLDPTPEPSVDEYRGLA